MVTKSGSRGGAASPAVARPEIEIFDPPMCCPTGLCGPTLDQTLLDVDEMVLELQADGHRVERYQMTSDPQAFLGNPEVMTLVRERQLDALPITVVRSRVVKWGEYPTPSEVRAALNGGSDG
jgi:hypothetical protein